MYLRLAPTLKHFLPDLGSLYALRPTPNFYEIHPWSKHMTNLLLSINSNLLTQHQFPPQKMLVFLSL
jgi:hypothetical protein